MDRMLLVWWFCCGRAARAPRVLCGGRAGRAAGVVALWGGRAARAAGVMVLLRAGCPRRWCDGFVAGEPPALPVGVSVGAGHARDCGFAVSKALLSLN